MKAESGLLAFVDRVLQRLDFGFEGLDLVVLALDLEQALLLLGVGLLSLAGFDLLQLECEPLDLLVFLLGLLSEEAAVVLLFLELLPQVDHVHVVLVASWRHAFALSQHGGVSLALLLVGFQLY